MTFGVLDDARSMGAGAEGLSRPDAWRQSVSPAHILERTGGKPSLTQIIRQFLSSIEQDRSMRWINSESYVGLCRRVAQRPHLQHRRRKDCAQPIPPDLSTLIAEVLSAYEEGMADLPQTQMRVEAGLDLAERLGEHKMAEAFRALREAAPGREARDDCPPHTAPK